ncbi:MAG: valine--pyruvate transaminase [Pseudomonadales bacterium]
MQLSAFGKKFSSNSGIVSLMDDLGVALNENPDAIFMGGGNPARIPAVEAVFRDRLQTIINDDAQCHSLLGVYQSPQGDLSFRKEMAAFLKRQFGWPVTEANISVSNGSQSAFFIIFNMLAGMSTEGSNRQIHLPLAPEYLGYGDSGISEQLFSASKPSIELLDNHLFKYHVDFDNLNLTDSTAALCVSRPTNPTGNVLTDAEIARLDRLAQEQSIPLIIDGAYGLPFPNILFEDAEPHWNENTILMLSLSKLGLPAARTGIVVASEEFSRAFSNATTISSLACGSLGPVLVRELLKDDVLKKLSDETIRPYYKQRATQAVSWVRELLDDALPYHIHKPEGAFFLWLWFDKLPISSDQLYQRLKQRGVLVVPGEPFFIGLDDDWSHSKQCIRVSYSQEESKVRRGFEIIAEEVALAYEQG